MTMHDAPPADGAGDESPPADDLVGDWVPADRPGHPAPVEVPGGRARVGAAAGGRAGERVGRGRADLFDLDDGIDDVAPRPRRRRSKLTTALAAVALVAAGGIAGIAVDQRWGPDASATTPLRRVRRLGARQRRAPAVVRPPVAPGRPVLGRPVPGRPARARPARAARRGRGRGQAGQGTGRGNGGGFGGFGGRAGAAAVGRVARVEGSTLVVTANDGSEVRVDTKGATITQPAPIAVERPHRGRARHRAGHDERRRHRHGDPGDGQQRRQRAGAAVVVVERAPGGAPPTTAGG